MRIYIAGPLSSKEKNKRNPSKVVTDYIQNIHKMAKVASKVRRLGHYPYVPGLDFLLGVVVGDWEEDDYRDIGMSFLEVCDAMLVTSWSWGVEQEIKFAQSKGIKILYKLEDIPHEKKVFRPPNVS